MTDCQRARDWLSADGGSVTDKESAMWRVAAIAAGIVVLIYVELLPYSHPATRIVVTERASPPAEEDRKVLEGTRRALQELAKSEDQETRDRAQRGLKEIDKKLQQTK
jgi:hypothetical protein